MNDPNEQSESSGNVKIIDKFKPYKIISMFCLSFIFIFTSVFAYRDMMDLCCELTFLSNFISGVFLFVSSILYLFSITVPQFLFLDITILLLIVFGVCMSYVKGFNFSGAFSFLHVVNPLLMLIHFLFFSNQMHVKWPFIFTILILPACYLTFAMIFGKCTGHYIYFFFDYKENGVGFLLLVIFAILFLSIAFAVGLYHLNIFIHKRIDIP